MSNFRTILMPLGIAGQAHERITGALAVAKHYRAHLDVLFTYVSPKETIPADIFGMSKATMDNLTQIADKHAANLAQKRKQIFLDLCEHYEIVESNKPSPKPIASAAWQEIDGLRSTVVAMRGRLADLIIVAKPPISGPSSLIEAALKETGRPVLLMPRTQKEFSANHIAIGWNGSAHVARALDSAMPCIREAKQITVITTKDRKEEHPSVKELLNYFGWHGVKAAIEILTGKSHSVGKPLFSKAKAIKADLLVLGGHSHRQVREMVMGSVTEYVLAEADLPVLMGH